MADDAETERVTFTIANLRTVNSKRLYALVDVELRVAGLLLVPVRIRRILPTNCGSRQPRWPIMAGPPTL
jgi:hypothetical protein